MKKWTNLEAVNHVLLRVHGLALLLDESLGQHAGVEFLVHVFVIHILKYGDAVAQFVVHLTLVQTFRRLFEQRITVSDQAEGGQVIEGCLSFNTQ